MSYFRYNGRRIYYEETGEGAPLLLLHGNTASSRMYEDIARRYSSDFRVILIDFLGHGRSDRLDEFPTDLWYEEGRQIAEFLREKGYTDARIIGSSGGALAAINAALEAPERISKVIADSFEGTHAAPEFTANLARDRSAAKRDPAAQAFFRYLHGDDWEKIVNNDTRAVLAHAQQIGSFFRRTLSSFQPEILFTGSRQDEFVSFIAPDYYETLFSGMIEEIGHGSMHIFETGGHPAMLSNMKEFLRLSTSFLK